MPRNQRTRDLPTGSAVALIVVGTLILLAVVAAVSLVVLVTHLPGSAAGAWLAVPALPLPRPWQRAVRWMRLRLLWWHIRETELQIAQYRRLIADDRAKLDALRDTLARQHRQQLQLASQR